jgi:hypothetical protein
MKLILTSLYLFLDCRLVFGEDEDEDENEDEDEDMRVCAVLFCGRLYYIVLYCIVLYNNI